MSLKGSLKTVALPEVLHLLSSTGKSGELHVSGSQREGRLWFENGRIAGFEAGRADRTSEAIFELLRVEDGDFSFAADAERPEGARVVSPEDGEVAPALEAAEEHLVEWNGIVEVVPSLAHRVQLRRLAPQEQVVLDADQWAMVVVIGDGRSVSDVLDACEKSEFDGCGAVRVLVEASLVEVLEPADAAGPEVVAVEPDAEAVEPDAEAVEPDVEAVEPDVEAVEPDVEAVEPEIEMVEAVQPQPFGYSESFAAVEAEAWPEVELDHHLGAEAAGEPEYPAVAFDSDPLGTGEMSFSQFPVVSSDTVEETSYEAYGAIGDGAFPAPESDVGRGPTTEEEDRYAALRAAMVEVGENLVEYTGEEVAQPTDTPVYELESDPQMDGRAALQALLSEVTTPSDEMAEAGSPRDLLDGLADRGPWTEHELSAMDVQGSWADEQDSSPADQVSNIVPFAPVHPVTDEAEPVESTSRHEADTEAEPEPAPAGETINRGLLLKFLSSVRN